MTEVAAEKPSWCTRSLGLEVCSRCISNGGQRIMRRSATGAPAIRSFWLEEPKNVEVPIEFDPGDQGQLTFGLVRKLLA